jgi:hypothetical protein
MSLKVMHWAWSVELEPKQKLVLLALADIADDVGFCFPSVPTLATKCTLSQRTVQRVLRKLSSEELVRIKARHRHDRARTSNGYKLAIERPPSNCHRAGDTSDTGVVTNLPGAPLSICHRGGDSTVGVTTIEPCINETTQQPFGHNRQAELGASPGDAQAVRSLCFPEGLTAAQQESIATQMTSLSACEAQQVLDELAGRLNLKPARERIYDPVRYCAGLVERFKRGEFQFQLGRAVAKDREAKQQVGVHLEQSTAEVAAAEAIPDQPPESFRAAAKRLRAGLTSVPGDSQSRADDGEATKEPNVAD